MRKEEVCSGKTPAAGTIKDDIIFWNGLPFCSFSLWYFMRIETRALSLGVCTSDRLTVFRVTISLCTNVLWERCLSGQQRIRCMQRAVTRYWWHELVLWGTLYDRGFYIRYRLVVGANIYPPPAGSLYRIYKNLQRLCRITRLYHNHILQSDESTIMHFVVFIENDIDWTGIYLVLYHWLLWIVVLWFWI